MPNITSLNQLLISSLASGKNAFSGSSNSTSSINMQNYSSLSSNVSGMRDGIGGKCPSGNCIPVNIPPISVPPPSSNSNCDHPFPDINIPPPNFNNNCTNVPFPDINIPPPNFQNNCTDIAFPKLDIPPPNLNGIKMPFPDIDIPPPGGPQCSAIAAVYGHTGSQPHSNLSSSSSSSYLR